MEGLPLVEKEPEAECDDVSVTDTVLDALVEELAEAQRVLLSVLLAHPVTLKVADADGEIDTLPVPDPQELTLPDTDGLGDTLPVLQLVKEMEPELVRLPDMLPQADEV